MRKKQPTLTVYFESSYSLYRNLQPGSVSTLARSIRKFVAWLGRDPLISELSDEMLSRWVMHLEATHAPKTAHGRRGDILGIWRDAWEADKTGKVEMPKRVRRVKVPDPEPNSWSAEEVATLVAVARETPGVFRPEHRDWEVIPRALYLEAIIRTAWETGLRKGDLLGLRLEQIGDDGIVAKAQGKTGVLHCGCLSAETVALLHKLNRNPPLAWGGTSWGLGYWFGRLRETAGLGTRGSLQKIRASAGTNVAIHQPGSETKFLGHTSAKADKWYIDKRRLPRCAVTPQALDVRQGKAKGGAA